MSRSVANMQAVRALEKKKQKDAERTRKAAEEKAATLAKYCGNAGKDMQEIAQDAKKLAKSVSKNQIVNDARNWYHSKDDCARACGDPWLT